MGDRETIKMVGRKGDKVMRSQRNFGMYLPASRQRVPSENSIQSRAGDMRIGFDLTVRMNFNLILP
jgi:hypothetical protein